MPPVELNDEELIELYLQGKKESFDALLKRHLNNVYSFVVRFVGDEHEAEDIVQEIFLKVWKNLPNYRRQSASFKTWLMHIARNSAIDFLRRRRHIPFSKFDTPDEHNIFSDLPDETPLPEEVLTEAEDIREVEKHIQELSPPYREVLLLYYGNDCTFEELGEILGISSNTVKSRHRRALVALRKLLHRKK